MDAELGKFLKFLINHHGSKLEEACRKFVETHPNTYREACENIRYASSIELYDPDYQRADIYVIKGVRLLVDIHVNAIAEVQDGSSRGLDAEYIYHWITIRCEYSVAKDELIIKKVFDYDGKTKIDGIQLDDDLLAPKIYRDDGYEKVAEYILNKYCPEVIDNITPVDIDDLAKKLNLNIKETRISKDGSIFGRICFVDTELELQNDSEEWEKTKIEKNTLLVDNEVGFLKSFGSPKITKAHECVHYIIHKAAFFFARKFKKKLSGIQCKVVGQGNDDGNLIPLQQFEIQANKLAPMILMPRKQFIKKAKDVIQMVNSVYGGNLLDETEEVIRTLADFYGTTMYSVRKRMAEVGYEYMLGSLNYVDGHYVAPYSFDNGSLKYNETFTISKNDYIKMFEDVSSYNELPNFGMALLSGSLVFVDNHLVVNDPKYIKKDIFGRKQLTNEARNHLNKCAIKFKITTNNAIDEEDRIGTMCYLCRDTTYTYALDVIVSDKENGIITKQSFDSYLNAAIQDNKDLFDIQLLTPEEALVRIMDKYGVTAKELKDKSKLSSRTIRRYRGEEEGYKVSVPDKETVIRICIGLELTPVVASYYLKACNVTLKQNDKLDVAYQAFLTGYGEYQIDMCNEALREADLPLFYESKEETE